MNTLEFVKQVNTTSFDDGAITSLYNRLVNNYKKENFTIQEDTRKFLAEIPEDKITSFNSKISACIKNYQRDIVNCDDPEDIEYKQKLNDINKFLKQLSDTFNEIVNKAKPASPVAETVAQHEKNLIEIKGRIDELKESVKKTEDQMDNKIFSLLTNVVAILGIFVAIAFTGFGIMSIFSNFDITTAIQSHSALIINVFFLLLVILASYNLLLLLVYFIFKLSRPTIKFIKKPKKGANSDSESTSTENSTFSATVNLKLFWIIDVAIAVLTIGAFVASFFVQ